MKLAAIDIGSNAIRLHVVKVFEDKDLVSFKNLEFLRFPLRLGKDVFKEGKITKKTQVKFFKLMRVFKNMMDLFEVNAFRAVATSAMREAKNSASVLDIVKEDIGFDIDIISGKEEATLLNKAIIPFLTKNDYIHIDVGGGSTELNVFSSRNLIDNKSFPIGSVRKLNSESRNAIFDEMKSWIKASKIHKSKNVMSIGTGGNINKLFKLALKPKGKLLSYTELKALRSYVREFTFEERVSILKMNEDRADVIVPASEIYSKVMSMCNSGFIMVPKVGLKDGVIYDLYESVFHRRLNDIEYLEFG